MRAILASAIGMVDAAWFRSAITKRLFMGSMDEFPGHARAHGIPDDFHGPEVFDASQVQPTLVGGNAGDVGPVDFPGSIDLELLGQEIRCYWQIMRRVGRGLEFPVLNATKPQFISESVNAITAYMDVLFGQFLLDPRGSSRYSALSCGLVESWASKRCHISLVATQDGFLGRRTHSWIHQASELTP